MNGKIFQESSNVFQDQAKILFDYYKKAAERIVSEEMRIESEISAADRKSVSRARIILPKNRRWIGLYGNLSSESMDKSGPRLRASPERQKVLLTLLRCVREERELRQADVAERLGCPQSVISKYERGERRLDLLELYELCSVIGISLTDLVKRFDRELRREVRKRRTNTKPSRRPAKM